MHWSPHDVSVNFLQKKNSNRGNRENKTKTAVMAHLLDAAALEPDGTDVRNDVLS